MDEDDVDGQEVVEDADIEDHAESNNEESEDELEGEDIVAAAAEVPRPSTPKKHLKKRVYIGAESAVQQQPIREPSNENEPGSSEATTSRKRSRDVSGPKAESRKRKLNDTSVQDKSPEVGELSEGTRSDNNADHNNLTRWPELPDRRPRSLADRRTELTKFSRDLRKYTNKIQAGAVPYTLVESPLQRVESYVEYTEHMLMGNVAAREAKYQNVETEVSTAMHEAMNRTLQALQNSLKGENEDCKKMRRKLTKAFVDGTSQ